MSCRKILRKSRRFDWYVICNYGVALLMFLTIGCSSNSGRSSSNANQSVSEAGAQTMGFTIQSSAFANNTAIPKKYTGDGDDVSPPLSWSGSPSQTAEFALICDDPDAPTAEPWVHWVIYKIPPTATSLPENVAKTARVTNPVGAIQGTNSWNNVGYGGSAPPRGSVHHYHFSLYALSRPLNAEADLTKTQLLSAMQGAILAEAEWVGTYQR